MQDKVLIIIIAMYALSFSLLLGQYIFLDPFHITMVDLNGNPVKNNVTRIVGVDNLNTISRAITQTDFSNSIQLVTAAANVIWQLLLILTGTYIFTILLLFGIPAMAVAAFQILYIILLAIFIIRALRPQ